MKKTITLSFLSIFIIVNVISFGQHPVIVPGGGGAGSGVTFGGNPVGSLAEDVGVDLELVGTTLTARADLNVMPTKAFIQADTAKFCAPSSGSGTAYSGCGSLAPTLTALSNGACFLFQPDVDNTGSATLDPDGAGATFGNITMQKISNGALVNLVANDLNDIEIYDICYNSASAVFIVRTNENRFYRDGTYNYTRLGLSGGAGVTFRQAIGVNTFDIRRGDNAAYATLDGVAEIRGKDASDNDVFDFNATQTAGNKAYFFRAVTTGDDPEQGWYQNFVQTTNNTITTLLTIPITNNRTTAIRTVITAECESGAGCTANDGAFFQLYCTYIAAAGTATEVGDAVSPTAQSSASLTLTVVCTPSAGNALIQVTGETNSTIRWTGTAEVFQ